MKTHYYDYSKAWKAGKAKWVPAMCGTPVAESYAPFKPPIKVTCAKCLAWLKKPSKLYIR